MSADYLSIAVRAFTEPVTEATDVRRKSATPAKQQRSKHVLVFDTETTTDASQRLTFGSYRCYRARNGLELRAEGLFYADDLGSFDPDGLAVLRAYAAARGLPCLSRREFL
jgi:hypothetical protein